MIKIKENILTDKLYCMCQASLESLKREGLWVSSELQRWVTSKGHILTAKVPEIICQDLKKELDGKLPVELDEYTSYRFYSYEPGSSLLFHTDAAYNWSATIYLGKWNIDWGGFFVYQNEDKSFSMVPPEENKLIYNSNDVSHAVSPISMYAPMSRKTIQIRGTKKRDA